MMEIEQPQTRYSQHSIRNFSASRDMSWLGEVARQA